MADAEAEALAEEAADAALDAADEATEKADDPAELPAAAAAEMADVTLAAAPRAGQSTLRGRHGRTGRLRSRGGAGASSGRRGGGRGRSSRTSGCRVSGSARSARSTGSTSSRVCGSTRSGDGGNGRSSLKTRYPRLWNTDERLTWVQSWVMYASPAVRSLGSVWNKVSERVLGDEVRSTCASSRGTGSDGGRVGLVCAETVHVVGGALGGGADRLREARRDASGRASGSLCGHERDGSQGEEGRAAHLVECSGWREEARGAKRFSSAVTTGKFRSAPDALQLCGCCTNRDVLQRATGYSAQPAKRPLSEQGPTGCRTPASPDRESGPASE